MMKTRNVMTGLSVFALALMLAFALPQAAMATSGQHEKGKAEINDPDVSAAMEQEAAETAQDISQGTKEAAQETEEMAEEVGQETEQMAAEAAEETSELVAETDQLIDRAAMSLKDVVTRSKKRIPKQVMDNAAGIAIFPDVTKAGFIAGGRYGKGLLMLNQESGWSGPLFISLYGASVGAQIGVEQTDLFMVFNNEEALRDLRDGDLTLGAETSVAAGTWGAKAGATTDADVLVYKQTEGLFAGASLSGAVINVDEDTNQAFFKNQKESKEGRAYYGSEKVLSGEQQVPKTSKADKVIVILTDWE